MQVDVELLTTSEGIALDKTHLQLWSHTSDGALHEIALNIEVVGTFEGEVHRHIERIASGGRVARGEVDINHREQTGGIHLAERLQVFFVTVELTGAYAHIGHQHTRADGGILPTVVECEVAALQAVGQFLHKGLPHADIHPTDIPLAVGLRRKVASQLKAEGSGMLRCGVRGTRYEMTIVAPRMEGVGQEEGVGGLIIVVAVVAKDVGDARPLGIKSRHGESIASLDGRFGRGNEAVGLARKAYVGNAVDG